MIAAIPGNSAAQSAQHYHQASWLVWKYWSIALDMMACDGGTCIYIIHCRSINYFYQDITSRFYFATSFQAFLLVSSCESIFPLLNDLMTVPYTNPSANLILWLVKWRSTTCIELFFDNIMGHLVKGENNVVKIDKQENYCFKPSNHFYGRAIAQLLQEAILNNDDDFKCFRAVSNWEPSWF